MSLMISGALAVSFALGQVPPLPSPHPDLSAFPQTAPLLSTLRWSYSLGRTEGEPGTGRSGLTSVTINGIEGALPPGTTKVDGAMIRAAYGLKAWGEDLRQTSWIQAADRIMNLAAASGIINGDKALPPSGVQFGAPETLQGVGYAVLYAARFPASPASSRLREQTESWISAKLDGRAPLSIDELGSITLASQVWPTDSSSRARLRDLLLPTGRRLFREARSLGEQLALAQALLDGRHLLPRDQQPELDSLASNLLAPGLESQLTQNDERTYPLPTKGFFSLTGPRQPLEAWHVSTVLQAGSLDATPERFRKGVSMLRGLMGLVSQPTGTENGLWHDDLFQGRLAPTPWMLVQQGAKSWPGFALAEGQFMTSLYHIHRRHGSIFQSSRGWREPVEALLLTKDGPISLLRQQPAPYSGAFILVETTGDQRVENRSGPAMPLAVRPLTLAYDSQGLKVIAAPAFIQTPNRPLNPSGVFAFPNGRRVTATLGDLGFEARVGRSDLAGQIKFGGSAGGSSLAASGMFALEAPSRQADWTLIGGAAFLGFDGVEGVAGTGSQTSRQFKGEALSRPFLRGVLALDYSAGPGCSIRVEDAMTGILLRSLQSGAPRSRITLDLSRNPSQLIRLRLVDRSERGFAAVHSISLKQSAM